MKKIGYLEGTDPTLLARLAMNGHGTMPLSNGWDNHGKYINHLGKEDKVDAVIGYLHKIFPPDKAVQGPGEMLFACRAHKIPVYLIVPKDAQKETKACLKTLAKGVKLVDPSDVYDKLTTKKKK